MCMPHGGGKRSSGFIKEDKPQKHIQKVSQEQFEKGDPDFIDERITSDEVKKKESIVYYQYLLDYLSEKTGIKLEN